MPKPWRTFRAMAPTIKPPSLGLDASPILDDDLAKVGAQFAEGATPASRGEDMLTRYRHVPNHMLIFYTSEDELVASYILRHWAALDRLSGETCDIYPSLRQLRGKEDAYSTLNDLPNIPGANTISIRELPLILIWSDEAFYKIPMRSFSADEASLRVLFRHVVALLRDIDRGITGQDQAAMTNAIMVAQSEIRPAKPKTVIYLDQRTQMSTTNNNTTNNNNTAGAGSVLITGGTARDISLHQNWASSPVDLSALAVQFEELRKALKEDGDSAEHDVAIGQIAQAEAAAKSGDRPKVMAALASTGKWVLGVAEKVTVGLASEAIKAAIGMK